jgi:SAM-dependent methyltransferase
VCVRDQLERHEQAWRRRGLLRRVYRGWYVQIALRLADVPGPTVELGSGLGRLREAVPGAVLTDVEPTPYADAVLDAEALPYEDGSVANLIMLDVFHHLARPAEFLAQAERVLIPGGRVILVEPYCSRLSTFAYRHFHHEDLDLSVDGLAEHDNLAGSPWMANLALPTLVFFRQAGRLAARFPHLQVRERRLFEFVAYMLSGGFSRRPLAPGGAYRLLAALERLLEPLGPLAAFRCIVVLERSEG